MIFDEDIFYIKRCLELAARAWGEVSPNPYVGAVIVKNGKIIAEGHHRGPGLPHAEIEAINAAKESVEGATLYCNLEPCCHTNKRTPPCAQKLIEMKIARVVVANVDPNPEVAGKGLALLKEAGIRTVSGICEEEGAELNEVFFHHITTKRPFVHLKWAQTLDGKMATPTGSSKWITGPVARSRVHHQRRGADAIMVGAQTLRADNPSLDVRVNDKRVKEPLRIVVSKTNAFDHELKFFEDPERSLLALPQGLEENEKVRTLFCETNEAGEIDLEKLLEALYEKGAHSIYVEGGPKLLGQFINQGLFQKISIYCAPKLIGQGVSPLEALELTDINQARTLKGPSYTQLGDDMLIEARGLECLQD